MVSLSNHRGELFDPDFIVAQDRLVVPPSKDERF
jgi:hypothetical protein